MSGEEGAISIRKPLKPQAPSPFINHFAHIHTTAGELDMKSRQNCISLIGSHIGDESVHLGFAVESYEVLMIVTQGHN